MSDVPSLRMLDLDRLTAITPFIVALNQDLTVIWASPSVRRRFQVVMGRNAQDLIAFEHPRQDLTRKDLCAAAGFQRHVILLDGEPPTPLIGYWMASNDGFVLLALPDVRQREELEAGFFTFEDLPADGFLVDLLLTQDRYRITLSDAMATIHAAEEATVDLTMKRRRPRRSGARAETAVVDAVAAGRALPAGPEDRPRSLPELAGTALFVVDAVKRIVDVNQAFCVLTGMSRDQALGQSCSLVQSARCAAICPLQGVSAAGAMIGCGCRIERADGTELEVLKNASLICDDNGATVGVVESIVDLSSLHRPAGTICEQPAGDRQEPSERSEGELHTTLADLVEILGSLVESDPHLERCEDLRAIRKLARSVSDLAGVARDESVAKAPPPGCEHAASGDNVVADDEPEEEEAAAAEEEAEAASPDPVVPPVDETREESADENLAGFDRSSAFDAIDEERVFQAGCPVPGAKILVVDDDRGDRQTLKKILTSWDLKPFVVNGARAAMAALRCAAESADPYELMLIDAVMPEEDGFSLAKKVQRDWATAVKRIVLMLDNGDEEQTKSCQELGNVSTISKPIKAPELLSIVEERSAPGQAWCDGAFGHVLLVGSQEPDRQQVEEMLCRLECEVTVSDTIEHAIERLREDLFDAVLFDLDLCRHAGIEDAAAFMTMDGGMGVATPIIGLTTSTSLAEDRERYRELRIDRFLCKPLQEDEVRQELIRERESIAKR